MYNTSHGKAEEKAQQKIYWSRRRHAAPKGDSNYCGQSLQTIPMDFRSTKTSPHHWGSRPCCCHIAAYSFWDYQPIPLTNWQLKPKRTAFALF